jgi:hypothetical protein
LLGRAAMLLKAEELKVGLEPFIIILTKPA